MGNREISERKRNSEKEMISKELYEISREEPVPVSSEFAGADVAKEICRILLKSEMNYMQMNEVLYQSDKALRQMAMTSILKT